MIFYENIVNDVILFSHRTLISFLEDLILKRDVLFNMFVTYSEALNKAVEAEQRQLQTNKNIK